MRETIRDLVDSLTGGLASWAVIEILLYAIGSAILFYLVDVLLMRWQGPALH
jgi:hypothetical protein